MIRRASCEDSIERLDATDSSNRDVARLDVHEVGSPSDDVGARVRQCRLEILEVVWSVVIVVVPLRDGCAVGGLAQLRENLTKRPVGLQPDDFDVVADGGEPRRVDRVPARSVESDDQLEGDVVLSGQLLDNMGGLLGREVASTTESDRADRSQHPPRVGGEYGSPELRVRKSSAVVADSWRTIRPTSPSGRLPLGSATMTTPAPPGGSAIRSCISVHHHGPRRSRCNEAPCPVLDPGPRRRGRRRRHGFRGVMVKTLSPREYS